MNESSLKRPSNIHLPPNCCMKNWGCIIHRALVFMSASSKFSIHLSPRVRVAVILPILSCTGAKCAIPLCGRKETVRWKKALYCVAYFGTVTFWFPQKVKGSCLVIVSSRKNRLEIKDGSMRFRVGIQETLLSCGFGLGLNKLRVRTPGNPPPRGVGRKIRNVTFAQPFSPTHFVWQFYFLDFFI